METQYVMRPGMDYTEARVRVDGEDIWIRVGGFKANEEAHEFLIEEAEQQARALRGVNGSRH